MARSLKGFPEFGQELQWPGAYNGKPTGIYFPPSSNQEKAYILNVLPAYILPPTQNQAHSVQLGQPNMFRTLEGCGLLSYMNCSIPGIICLWARGLRVDAILC